MIYNLPSNIHPNSVEAINHFAFVFSGHYQRYREEKDENRRAETKFDMDQIAVQIMELCLKTSVDFSEGVNSTNKKEAFLVEKQQNELFGDFVDGEESDDSESESEEIDEYRSDEYQFDNSELNGEDLTAFSEYQVSKRKKFGYKDCEMIVPSIVRGVYINDVYVDLLMEMLGFLFDENGNLRGMVYNHEKNDNFIAAFKNLYKKRKNNYKGKNRRELYRAGIVSELPDPSDYYDGKRPNYERVYKEELMEARVEDLDAPLRRREDEGENADYYSKLDAQEGNMVDVLGSDDSYNLHNPQNVVIAIERYKTMQLEFAKIIHELHFAFGSEQLKAENKKTHVFHAAYTFDIIKNAEDEKKEGIDGKPKMDPYGENTDFYIEYDLLLRPTMRDGMVIYLKGGKENDYKTMTQIIEKDLLEKDANGNVIDLNQRGGMIFNHLKEFGLKIGQSTVYRILKENYDQFKSEVIREVWNSYMDE